MSKRLLSLCAVFLSTVGACTCADSVDKAAKKRIFSPEDPPRLVVAAKEPLNVADAPSNSGLTHRILTMGASETTERLGAHHYSASLITEWAASGGQTVRWTETRDLFAGKGGINGDFHAVMENSRDQGIDVLRVSNEVFARSRYGKFRQRLRDRGMAENEREEVFGALRDFESLFNNQIHLESQGKESVEGRSGVKFRVGLSPEPNDVGTAERALPPIVLPKNGMDATTQRRARFAKEKKPVSIEGTLVVDADTGVVLKADVQGEVQVTSEEDGKATLKVALRSSITDIGKVPPLVKPADFLPDADKPGGIADALDRFGIPRNGKGNDAGVEAEPVPDE